MKNVTITIYVEPTGFQSIIQVLTILDNLDFDNEYTFQPHDIEYSESSYSHWIQLNVPVDLYLKFKYKYNSLVNKSVT
jgi:hypothetical protein